jgi:hypothetical protein
MTFQLTADQQVNATVAFVNQNDSSVVVTLDSTPIWISDNLDVLTVNTAADGLSAELVTVGPAGSANVNFSTIVGGVSIITTLDVVVVAGVVVSATITPGTPLNKPSDNQ